MKYKIESNIPLPEGRASRYGFPFNDMKVNDSFFFGLKDGADAYVMKQAAYQAAHRMKMKIPGFKIKIHKEVHGFRIWRIA